MKVMGATASPERLIIAALVGLVILLVLIIGVKLQAILAILISAVAIGLMAGMPYSAILESVGTGMGNTLKGIAPVSYTHLDVYKRQLRAYGRIVQTAGDGVDRSRFPVRIF